MAVASNDNAMRTGNFTADVLIYLVLLSLRCSTCCRFGIMLVNSLKPLEEITGGNMVALPQQWTIEPWLSGLVDGADRRRADGLAPYFWNSIAMVVPAVIISTILGALNGYVLTKWQFRGATILFGLMLFSCFIPFQIVLIPMARILGILMGIAGTTYGPDPGPCGLRHRLLDALFPQLLRGLPDRAGARGADRRRGFFQIFWRIMLPSSGPIIVVCVIWQFTNIWNDFLFGASFAEVTAAADDGGAEQPRQVLNRRARNTTSTLRAPSWPPCQHACSSTSWPGRFFVRGLMAGSVKG